MPNSKEQSSYLKKLKFDPKLISLSIAKYLSNLRLVILLFLMVIIVGVTSYSNLPRNINPEIKIPLIIITTILPGTGPNDVESLITTPLEDPIRSLSRIKTVTSSSRDSVSVITAEFETGVDPDKARTDVKAAVDSVTDLPSDAQTPNVFKLDFENQPIWTFVLTGSEDFASLMRFAKSLQKELADIPSVDKVNILGLEEEEIQILIKPESLTTYNLNAPQITQIIKASLKSLPAGPVKTEGSQFSLTIDPGITTVDDIRNTKINLVGSIVSLQDVAIIAQKSKPDQVASFLANNNQNPSRAISFSIFRTSSVKIDTAISDSKKVINSQLNTYGNRFLVSSITNVGTILDDQSSELLRDFLLTSGLVAITLFVFLGIRQSAVSILAIPLTFLVTFTVMNLTGVSLSFISQFSLLLSLGLLVDDTIVVISAITAYYRSGKFTPIQAGLLVWKDFLTPVLTTTITTVWAFLPLLLSGGIIGEFIKPIPIVVSTTLIASIFIALFITLPFMIFLLKPNLPWRIVLLLRILGIILILALFYIFVPKSGLLFLQVIAFVIFLLITFRIRRTLLTYFVSFIKSKNIWLPSKERFQPLVDNGLISFHKLSFFYKRLIVKILSSQNTRRKTLIMVAVFSVFSYLLFPLGLVKNEFFPKSDGDFLYVTIELPSGTNLTKSTQEGVKVLEQLKQTPGVKFITLDVGQSFSSTGGVGSEGVNNLLYSLVLPDKKNRHIGSVEIARKLRERFSSYSQGKFSVQELSGGPPAGADLQIKLFGSNLQILDKYARKIKDYLAKLPGVTNIDQSIKSGTSKLVFIPDKNKLAENNLSADQVGFTLRLFASGLTVDKIKLDLEDLTKEEINIRLNSTTQSTDNIYSMNIQTPNGPIPLSSLGQINLEPNPTLITHEGGKRTLSVTSSVTPGFSVTDLNKKLENYAKSLNLPSGYSWATGGANEENQKSVLSILQAMGLSFLLIIITMVTQFSSFRKALIVMLVIPLSISGVFIVFALTQTPLSFPALIGMLALFGIVVKNSILVVDKINANDKAGLPFIESIADAASSRLEPIALTSLTAIFGLIPITLSDALWQGLGGAIIAGLTFSGTIMLFFIPVVYYLIFNTSEERSKKS